MLEKLYEILTYSIRGGVYAAILISLATSLFFISFWLYEANEAGSLLLMSKYIAQGLLLLSLGSLVAATVVWLTTWISDYRSDYLPNWLRRWLY